MTDRTSNEHVGAKRYKLTTGHSDDAGLGGEGWVVRMSDHFPSFDTAQKWVKSEDYEALRQRFEKACQRVTELESSRDETAPSLALELRSNLHGGPAPALHDGVTGKAKCVICGNFNRFWYVISGCNFCQSCVSEALSSPLEPARELTLLDFGYAPGNYTFKCHDCGQEAVGDKRALRCETCAAQALRENRRGAVKAAVVTNECTHEFRPIDSSGQRVCIYCNVRQEKASAPAWDCACNELDCPYCANRNALNGSVPQQPPVDNDHVAPGCEKFDE